MCGLIGRVGRTAADLFTDYVDPTDLLDRIAHRGPDGRGYATFGDVMLGHTRLAIQDASGESSAQPYRQGHITLTYNGELWNADALDVGTRTTTGDTEVVAKMIQGAGVDALGSFDGMWAVAWYDHLSGLVRLARDPHGKVPLYWQTLPGGQVEWASEYGALTRGGTPRPVQPGEVVVINPQMLGTTLSGPYEQEALTPPDPSPEAVLALLERGVAKRLVGDRPIAFMLSGGLDSSLILGLAAQHYPGRIVAYTASLDEGSRDLAEAAWVAGHFGVELVRVPVPPVTPERIAEAVRVVEIPMKAQVEIALAHLPVVEAMASDGFAVCLSGEAADELFGGYGGMQIKASQTDDAGYRAIKRGAVEKMARGNFSRVNKVGMRHGVECRLPFMERELVELAINATKAESPPGKKLLKEAARGLVPDRIIARPKDTFQGSVGTASAASLSLMGNPVTHYNRIAREAFGHLPRS